MTCSNNSFIFHKIINQLFFENKIKCKKLFYEHEIYFNFSDIIKYFESIDIVSRKKEIKKIKIYTLNDILLQYEETRLKKTRFNNLNTNYDVINFFKQKGQKNNVLFLDEKGLLEFSEMFYETNNDFIKFVFHSLVHIIDFKNMLLEEIFLVKKKKKYYFLKK